MRKLTLLLAIVAVAATPSLASAKAKHHAGAHHAKVTKVAKAQDLNADTYHLFADMFAPPAPAKKK